jgi:predicted dehydrogenase/threonine dehydrogenase-like Zn-dependent dehydrogenase
MKQIIQNARGGRLQLKSVPDPVTEVNSLLVQTLSSLISAGTERQMIGFAKSSMVSKARARPDLVRKVMNKVKRDGVLATMKSVVARLDEPLPLGYSAAGSVVEVGPGLEGRFRVGQMVAMAGVGIANHAEFNVVPESLVVPVPQDVTAERACFATLCSIALHSVRLTGLGLGDFVAVLGAGLVGQLVSQFAKLAGARVIVLDYNAKRVELARSLGADAGVVLGDGNPADAVAEITNGKSCDSVLIAAATQSSDPFKIAGNIARDRATICLVGITGTEFPYRQFMQKELRVLISRSYGPGRYDRDFEQRGAKYPPGYVRWTETENLREATRLMSTSESPRLSIDPLITHRFPFERAEDAYALVLEGTEPHLGVVLEYGSRTGEAQTNRSLVLDVGTRSVPAQCRIGAIGAGSFGKATILPALKSDRRVYLDTLVTRRGVSSENTGSRFGFRCVSSSINDILDNEEINAVVITTTHSSHAKLVVKSIEAGKHVFVEKPLALSHDELRAIIEARQRSSCFFSVGFNRRFAPYVVEMRRFLNGLTGRSVISIRVNAGKLEPESWQNDADEGRGRILGELCHFVDLAMYLSGSSLLSVSAQSAKAMTDLCEDVSVALCFSDGSLANILYTTLGDSSFGKELIECYKCGAICRIDNFRRLAAFADGKAIFKRSSLIQDKGHVAQLHAFVEGVLDGNPPIDEQSLLDSSIATLLVLESLRLGRPVRPADL